MYNISFIPQQEVAVATWTKNLKAFNSAQRVTAKFSVFEKSAPNLTESLICKICLSTSAVASM